MLLYAVFLSTIIIWHGRLSQLCTQCCCCATRTVWAWKGSTRIRNISLNIHFKMSACVRRLQCVRCVCGCRVKAEGQNVFSHRTEPALQHPQCSGGDMHLAARHQLANEISPCCHVSIPAIPALADMKSVLHFSWKTENIQWCVPNERLLQLLKLYTSYWNIMGLICMIFSVWYAANPDPN